MDRIAQGQLDAREKEIAAVRTVADAERRKEVVRRKILAALGGLPDYAGPLNARITGQIQADGYVIEKVIYESLPGFYVTANLYRPNQPGRYPAVLLQAGHTQEGKAEPQWLAANLALKGFVSLAFDPVGQGEREQTYDRAAQSAGGGLVGQRAHPRGSAGQPRRRVVDALLHLGCQEIDRLPRQPAGSGSAENWRRRVFGWRRADHLYRRAGLAAESGHPRLFSKLVSAAVHGGRSPFRNDPSGASRHRAGYGGFRGVIRSHAVADPGDRTGLFHAARRQN